MDTKTEDTSFYTPAKTWSPNKSSRNSHNESSINESFHEVQDRDSFFQPARLYDVDNRESLMLLKNLDEIDITRNSLGISKDFYNLGKESVDFRRETFDLRKSIHLKKESLDLRRETNNLKKDTIDLRRDTMDLRRETMDLRRDTMDLRRDTMDLPRESLGILAMSMIDDELSNSYSLLSPSVTSILNRGMLYSQDRSELLSNSFSKSPLKSVIDSSVEYPVFSPIHNSFKQLKTHISPTFKECSIKVDPNILKNVQQFGGSQNLLKEPFVGFKTKFQRSFSVGCKVEEDKKFNDSIFIEARALASKIGDNSVFEEDDKVCHLESVLQPKWLIEEQITKTTLNKELSPICHQTKENHIDESHLNTVNQNTPEKEVQINNIKMQEFTENVITPNTSKRSETHENISKIFQNKSSSRVSISSNLSSKDAKEILENLSEILASENPTNEQKTEGQNLIYNLAHILANSGTSTRTESSDDSGHSSIENDREKNVIEAIKVTPVKQKGVQESEVKDKPLDLSLNGSKRPLNRSMSCPGASKVADIVPKVLKNCRVSIPNTLKPLNVKLKPKKIEEKKKGPMKATLPLGNMAKVFTKQCKITVTPTRKEGSSGIKTVTTPNDSIRPVAQSTPEIPIVTKSRKQSSPSHLPKPKFSCPVSPLARPNRESSGKVIQRTLTESATNIRKQSPLMNRRKSSSDIKIEAQPVQTRVQRSNSISKDVKPSPSNLGLDKKRSLIRDVKSLNIVSKFRKSAGKENLPQ